MDTMEITKIVGAVCGALLIYLLVNWAGELIYHVESGDAHAEHAEEDGAKKLAGGYIIEVAEETSSDEAAEVVDIATLLASADVEKGKKVFSKCKACHKVEDGANGTGPHLFNVVDRAIGAIAGYGYSSALADKGGNWDVTALDGFIEKPKAWAPGTKMSFAGLKKPTDRANLIAYLQTIK